MTDDIMGIDDFIAQQAFARRVLLRHLADDPGAPASARCGRPFMHPRQPAASDALGQMADTCACVRASGHDFGCWCEHGMQRVVYRVDDDGREHYATLPLR
jgi:hypothetical protein